MPKDMALGMSGWSTLWSYEYDINDFPIANDLMDIEAGVQPDEKGVMGRKWYMPTLLGVFEVQTWLVLKALQLYAGGRLGW